MNDSTREISPLRDWILTDIATTVFRARLEAAKRRSDFEYEFERNGVLDLSSAKRDDLRKYLDLLVDERSATSEMQHWRGEIDRVESDMLRGEHTLEQIRAVKHEWRSK
jgi:hypothetical protein